MKTKTIVFLFGISTILCGNTFAFSQYANAIKQSLSNKSFLTVASFPKTVADATFVERMENKEQGYRPYFNASAFADLTIAEQKELESMAYKAEVQRLHAFNTQPLNVYCKNYPADAENCPNADTTHTDTGTKYGSIYSTNHSPTSYNGVPYMRAALTPENIAKYNLKTHNGGCTPPEHNHHWGDKILTSGRYAQSDPAFEKFMITSFRKEGSCGSHPNDHGGYTCYGCASNGLCAGIDMKNITRSKVEDLYYTNVYTAHNVNKLPDAFRGYLLWGMSGSGSITGIKQFQAALGVEQSGKIDDATIYAAEHFVGDFADVYTNNREQFYLNIVARDASQDVFLNGWLNGLQLLRPSGCHVVPTNPIYR